MAQGYDLSTILTSLLGGGVVGGFGVQWLKNRGNAQTRHGDELSLFRKELREELHTQKTESRAEIAELKSLHKVLSEDFKKQSEEFSRFKLDFAVYRERVKIFISYVRTNNPAALDLAHELEHDQHSVDELMEARHALTHQKEAATGPHILVVDDNADTATVLKTVLELAHYHVETAASGILALKLVELAKLEGRPYDLIILDQSMPGLSGEEVGRLIRIDGDQTSKIAFYTGNPDMMAPGGAELIHAPVWTKPMMPDEMVRRVSELLGGKVL